MRLSIKIIVGAAVVAASVAAATFGASAPAAAAERTFQAQGAQAPADMSARKRSAKRNGTHIRVSRLSRQAGEPPNPNRPYYRPVPPFFPFAQDRGYF
jgi:hypothetical protein